MPKFKNYWKQASILLLGTIVMLALLTAATRPKDDPFLAAAIKDKPFPSLTYSVQAFLWWDSGHVGLHLDWVNLMSFNHVKQIFAWRDMEPEKGEWHFEQSDRIMGEVERRNIKMIARLGKTPEWAASAWEAHADPKMTDAPADNLDDWRTYCHTVAERYKGQIAAYQIWNEPNLSREWGNESPDAEDYVELLRVCSEAIRSVDADAIIISAGLAPTGTNSEGVTPDDVYLDHMYRNEFQQYVDAVGVHAPGFSAPAYGPDDAERDGGGRWFTFRRVEDLRKIMIMHDDAARQMAILEFGWTTDTQNGEYSWYAVDEATQSEYLLEAYQYAIDHWRPWIGLMTVIYLPDPSWTEDDEEYWWGISTPELRQRQAFYDLANMQKSVTITSFLNAILIARKHKVLSQPTLALSLFFHISATVLWIGGLLVTVLLVWPEMRRILAESPALYQLLSRMRKRFFPISNLALVTLVVTGLFQMTSDPNYDGLLTFDNEWSRVMLVKHLVIIGMAVSGLILQYGVVPSLERTSLLLERDKGDAEEWKRLRRREVRLTWLNVILGMMVLGFSAWASSL